MNAWPMPEMQRQIDSMREAFSADLRKPFELKPSFPYGSPSPTTSHASPPRQQLPGSAVTPPSAASLRQDVMRAQSVDQMIQHQHQQRHQQRQYHQQLGPALSRGHPSTGYIGNPISPPISVGTSDIKTLESPLSGASLGLMSAAPDAQGQHAMANNMVLGGASGWNPSRLFESVPLHASFTYNTY